MSERIKPKPAASAPRSSFTDEELRLGKRAMNYMLIICVLAIVSCLGMAIYVFQAVPLNTVLPYEGRHARNGMPVLIAMLLPLVFPAGLLRAARKGDADQMHTGSRRTAYILGSVLVFGAIWAQGYLAHWSLVQGGALPS